VPVAHAVLAVSADLAQLPHLLHLLSPDLALYQYHTAAAAAALYQCCPASASLLPLVHCFLALAQAQAPGLPQASCRVAAAASDADVSCLVLQAADAAAGWPRAVLLLVLVVPSTMRVMLLLQSQSSACLLYLARFEHQTCLAKSLWMTCGHFQSRSFGLPLLLLLNC
jgi:hypothetical protein